MKFEVRHWLASMPAWLLAAVLLAVVAAGSPLDAQQSPTTKAQNASDASATQHSSSESAAPAPRRRSTTRELLPDAGRLIFLDPDTGRLTSTPDVGFSLQLLDLVERRRALANGIITVLPDGTVRGWPGPGAMDFLVATVDEDGKTHLGHQSLSPSEPEGPVTERQGGSSSPEEDIESAATKDTHHVR